jgi:hypothetical protein
MTATKRKKAAKLTTAAPQAPMPTLNYEAYIAGRADRLAQLTSGGPGEPPESAAARRASIERSVRQRLREWQNLGDFIADALEAPETPERVKAALWAELDELSEAAGDFCAMSNPDVVRLLYPLLRDIAEEKGGN